MTTKSTNPKTQANRHNQNLRTEAEAMLRDLAFVLKMTERVRKQIDPTSVKTLASRVR